MPIRIRRRAAAALCCVLSIAGVRFLLPGLNSRDVIHLYSRGNTPDVYEIFEAGGPGFAGLTSSANNYIPRISRDGAVPISFPVSSKMYQLRIDPGTLPVRVAIVRVCLERDLFVTHCISGGNLLQYVDKVNEATLTKDADQLIVDSKGNDPYLEMSPRLTARLRPSTDAPLFLARCCIAAFGVVFFFCFCYSWIAPLMAFWNQGATMALISAVTVRCCFFARYGGGAVSDSVLFENYLHQHLFLLPGIRGIVYPLFISIFSPRANALFITQLAMGSLATVMVLMLVRSVKKASRWDILWSLAATSIPTLLVMESIVLSETLAAFLILAALAAFRDLQIAGFRVAVAAGLGASCALLYQTKPQFGFAIFLFALALLLAGPRPVIRAITAFSVPVLALGLLVMMVNSSAGNFRGITSTLGYSLFDHAQQLLTCPGGDPDPHIEYYCRARASLGTSASPTSYTAWVIYPAMHELHELFPEVTADYARLSFRLIAAHPAWYAGSVARSFRDFWIDDVPMVATAIRGQYQKAILTGDRFLRRCFAILFFLSVAAFLIPRARSKSGRESAHFCLLTILIVLGSAAVQALAESGNEQARFAVPTMPLLVAVSVFAAGRFWVRYPARARPMLKSDDSDH